ncbi:hypothetical protein SAZ10_00450 [Mesorhizobium sp. BAC0120]|uniref:hypothetical protein n=1 Tax=Mesorhizobium sp. BAC0120 TaxID=3090670 RepID=UPI00298D371A|nr:hypothetical protein [Mesorhizobium sp. BAC0120]MDW6020225.1 hypothetical protein [Mesorhizobium sp. BAC0120]
MTAILYALGAALIAVIVAFLKGRMDGAKLERAKRAESEKKARDIADQVDNDLGAVPPATARKELKTWNG